MSTVEFIENIVEPEDAADAGVRVNVGPAREIMLGPEGEAEWGFFMFPTVWKLRDGRLVCAVTVGNDEMPSHADYHYMWYLSDDGGVHWTHAVLRLEEAEEFLRQRQTLPDGRQVYFEPVMISLDSVPKNHPPSVHLAHHLDHVVTRHHPTDQLGARLRTRPRLSHEQRELGVGWAREREAGAGLPVDRLGPARTTGASRHDESR